MRKALFCILVLSLSAFALRAQDKDDAFRYVNAEELMTINKGFDNTALAFSRLPADMKPVIRKDVWSLGLNSAGIAVRFASNAKVLKARWATLNNNRMNHMAPTGICGLDLYMLNAKGEWQYAGTARPDDKKSEKEFGKFSGEWHEYMVYLPLYDGCASLEIGVDKESEIVMPRQNILVKGQKPVIFYGTSITQGGCASRPGMVYTSILSRKWQRECVNLGFSGNGRLDKSMAEAMARVDAEAYVLDCVPNCSAQILKDSAYVFLRILHESHPDTPVYMVENVEYMNEFHDKATADALAEKNAVWKGIYKELRKEGYRNLKFIPKDKLSGKDGEDTVDTCHRTDLGFLRIAEGMSKYMKF